MAHQTRRRILLAVVVVCLASTGCLSLSIGGPKAELRERVSQLECRIQSLEQQLMGGTNVQAQAVSPSP